MPGHSCTELFKRAANWMANLVIAGFCLVVLWLLLQITTYASFKVPSGSMEPTLRPGDFVLVNKWLMGARIFDVQQALAGEQVRIHRLPGLKHSQEVRGRVMVFNFPYPDAHCDSLYMDVMLYYVKRCIALPGDTVEVRGAHYYVNSLAEPVGNLKEQDRLEEMLRFESTDALQALGINNKVLGDSLLHWSLWQMGPMIVPEKGNTVQLTRSNTVILGKLIEWETGEKLTVKGDSVYLGGEHLSSYTFGKNYYFMAGDNVMHSNDSRYWGLVPEEYIVGVATHIWKSENPRTGKMRWSRVMKRI